MKKILIGCLGAAALFAILTAGAVWYWFFRDLPNLEASLSLPQTVELDASVTMLVTTTNTHKTAVTLDSIDIDDSFLKGFQVGRITPKPRDTSHFFGQRSWDFGRTVAPGESLEIEFTLKAIQEGHFSGDLDVCNPNQDFTTQVADVVVRKKGESEIP